MRHQCAHRKFSRSSAHRKAMLRSMATSLLRQGQFKTTVQKAKDLRPVVERLITLARKDSVSARRAAHDYLMDKTVVRKLFTEIAPRYRSRPGGYTRIAKLAAYRHGDAASMAVLLLVPEEAPTEGKAPPKKKRAARKPAVKAESEKDAEQK